MKNGFYPKLAFSSMRKNKSFYLPYILTCVGMVMMEYIINFLSVTPVFSNMPGGGVSPSDVRNGLMDNNNIFCDIPVLHQFFSYAKKEKGIRTL